MLEEEVVEDLRRRTETPREKKEGSTDVRRAIHKKEKGEEQKRRAKSRKPM